AGEDQQETWGLAAPRKGKRLRQHLIADVQKVRQIHARPPAHGHGSCSPPNQRKRQQPDPPWGWRFLQSAFSLFVAGGAASLLQPTGFPVCPLLPQGRKGVRQ